VVTSPPILLTFNFETMNFTRQESKYKFDLCHRETGFPYGTDTHTVVSYEPDVPAHPANAPLWAYRQAGVTLHLAPDGKQWVEDSETATLVEQFYVGLCQGDFSPEDFGLDSASASEMLESFLKG